MTRNLLAGLMALTVVCAPMLAHADRTDLKDAPPIRGALKYRADRHAITPVFGFTVNDAFQRTFTAGLSYRYFLANWVGIGLDFMAGYVSLDTGLTEQIDDKLSKEGFTGKPSTSSLGFLVGVGATFVPIYGKMMLFRNFQMAYDVHVIVGAGVGTTRGQGRIESSVSFSPMWGLGARLFFSEWIAAEISFRDYIIQMPLVAEASVVSAESTWEQNFMVTVGVSFFFPPDIEQEL